MLLPKPIILSIKHAFAHKKSPSIRIDENELSEKFLHKEDEDNKNLFVNQEDLSDNFDDPNV